jgi:4'-phosphopantetheinyl transferase
MTQPKHEHNKTGDGQTPPGNDRWSPPPSRPVLAGGEVHVWHVNLATPPSTLQSFERILSDDENSRAQRLYFSKDRNRFLVCRGFLRRLLGLYLNLEPAGLRFCYSDRGKPFLADECGGDLLSFNLSHSHGMALYAITLDSPVGIDLEYCRREMDYLQVAKQFSSPREIDALRNLSGPALAEAFFTLWTCKEAYAKAIGLGLSCPLDQIQVSAGGGKPARFLDIGGNSQKAADWSLRQLVPQDGYLAAVAVKGHDRPLKCWVVNPHTVF